MEVARPRPRRSARYLLVKGLGLIGPVVPPQEVEIDTRENDEDAKAFGVHVNSSYDEQRRVLVVVVLSVHGDAGSTLLPEEKVHPSLLHVSPSSDSWPGGCLGFSGRLFKPSKYRQEPLESHRVPDSGIGIGPKEIRVRTSVGWIGARGGSSGARPRARDGARDGAEGEGLPGLLRSPGVLRDQRRGEGASWTFLPTPLSFC